MRFLAAVAVFAAAVGIGNRHPYLLRGYPGATRVRAERVLAAGNIVTMQRHAGAASRPDPPGRRVAGRRAAEMKRRPPPAE